MWTVPVRAVPRNVIRQLKYKLVEGTLKQVEKWRVTTDDSIAEGVSDISRNAGIASEDLGNVDLPVSRFGSGCCDSESSECEAWSLLPRPFLGKSGVVGAGSFQRISDAGSS